MDTLKRAHILFHAKFKSGAYDFTFEHCYVFLKDYLRWTNGSLLLKITYSKQKMQLEEKRSNCIDLTNMEAKKHV